MSGMTIQITKNMVLAGKSFSQTLTLSAASAIPIEADVPAAKAGTLSTRTDDNTGTLTLGSGHGVTTGDRLDLYWSGGSRRGITVGTVSGTSVPIDLGSGDVLPSQGTAITAMVPVEKVLLFDGDNLKALTWYSDAIGTFVIAQSNDTEEWYKSVQLAAGAGLWHENDGDANPLVGDTLAKVFMSHNDSTATKTMRIGVLLDQ